LYLHADNSVPTRMYLRAQCCFSLPRRRGGGYQNIMQTRGLLQAQYNEKAHPQLLIQIYGASPPRFNLRLRTIIRNLLLPPVEEVRFGVAAPIGQSVSLTQSFQAWEELARRRSTNVSGQSVHSSSNGRQPGEVNDDWLTLCNIWEFHERTKAARGRGKISE